MALVYEAPKRHEDELSGEVGNVLFQWLPWLALARLLGGNYAIARYHFRLPADARHVERHIRGSTGCCSPGSVSKSWIGNTARVKVTGWREYTVEKVRITYQHRVRVRSFHGYSAFPIGTWTGSLPQT